MWILDKERIISQNNSPDSILLSTLWFNWLTVVVTIKYCITTIALTNVIKAIVVINDPHCLSNIASSIAFTIDFPSVSAVASLCSKLRRWLNSSSCTKMKVTTSQLRYSRRYPETHFVGCRNLTNKSGAFRRQTVKARVFSLMLATNSKTGLEVTRNKTID